MKAFVIVLLASLCDCALADKPGEADSHKGVPPHTPAILCADQADNRIRLVDPLSPDRENATLWCYPAAGNEGMDKYRPTDAKRVEINDEVFILAAYHGRVRLVRFRDAKLIKDFPTYDSCHSAELLPDGVIVSVSSNHGILRLHHSAKKFVDIKLPYGHGATWDKRRRCLWVLGDGLYRFSYIKGTLSLERKFALPGTPTGHDLFPLRKDAKLLVSNNEALFLFDIEKEEFEAVSKLNGIKSASQHSDGSIWVSEPRKIEGAASWQSDAVVTVLPKGEARRHTIEGARFYKARWWQDVKFSY